MEDSNFMEDDYDDPLNPNASVSVSDELEADVVTPAKRKRTSTIFKGEYKFCI